MLSSTLTRQAQSAGARASTVPAHTRRTRQPAFAAPGPRHRATLLCHCQAPDQQQQGPSSSGEAPVTQQPRESAPSTRGGDNSNGGISSGFLAGGAVAAGVLLFAATRLLSAEPTLAALEETSVPLEQALVNGRPTVMEFYASWCEVCRELVPTEYAMEQQYGKKVNFVMLNVENNKWAPEVADYGVMGIPHFVFLDSNGQPLAAAVGRLPREVLEGNVSALADGRELPYARVRGETSELLQSKPGGGRTLAGPRDHA